MAQLIFKTSINMV